MKSRVENVDPAVDKAITEIISAHSTLGLGSRQSNHRNNKRSFFTGTRVQRALQWPLWGYGAETGANTELKKEQNCFPIPTDTVITSAMWVKQMPKHVRSGSD